MMRCRRQRFQQRLIVLHYDLGCEPNSNALYIIHVEGAALYEVMLALLEAARSELSR